MRESMAVQSVVSRFSLYSRNDVYGADVAPDAGVRRDRPAAVRGNRNEA